MSTKRLTKGLILSAAAVAGALLVGCQKQGNHDKWVNQAEERYATMRTALMLDMAHQQFRTGDLDLAEKTIKNAMIIDPDSAKLFTLAGRIALERGQLERSFHLFETALELEPKFPDPRYYQGVVLQRWQQFDNARERYREAYELEPDNIAYLLATSQMLVQLDRTVQARELLLSKVRYFAQNPAIRAAIGHLYRMTEQPAEAADYFEQAALLAPDNLKLKEELARSQMAAGRSNKAIGALESLLETSKLEHRRDLHLLLAQAYLDTGRVDQARRMYLDMARSAQGQAGDWVKLGELALKSGEQAAALQAAGRAIDLAPHRHEGYLLAGMVWQKRGKLDESLKMFDRAAQLAPDSAVPLILRGISLERAERKAAAAHAYSQALRLAPDDVRVQRLLANVQ